MNVIPELTNKPGQAIIAPVVRKPSNLNSLNSGWRYHIKQILKTLPVFFALTRNINIAIIISECRSAGCSPWCGYDVKKLNMGCNMKYYPSTSTHSLWTLQFKSTVSVRLLRISWVPSEDHNWQCLKSKLAGLCMCKTPVSHLDTAGLRVKNSVLWGFWWTLFTWTVKHRWVSDDAWSELWAEVKMTCWCFTIGVNS